MNATDSITVTTLVDVDPETAFTIFTEEIESWWVPRIPRLFRNNGSGRLHFETGPNGRLLETYTSDNVEPFEVGRILTWSPPSRLAFEWRQGDFAPNERTRVEVLFEPEGEATRVTVVHSGWDLLPAKHPSKLGYSGEALRSMLALRWADLIVAFRAATIGKS